MNYIKRIMNFFINEFKLSVIVAIYNNGYYLENRCFPSLMKSTIFKDMEIILVDDGSDDISTINIIKNLEKNNKNVKAYFLQKGGSGSASRPRNYGLKVATSKYITYLDPDNEAIEDGYFYLYEAIKNDEYDIVVGNTIFFNKKLRLNNYYKYFIDRNKGVNESNNPKEVLKNTKYMPQSIQASLIKKDIIEQNNLNMVEKANGEDTLFYYEVLLNSKNIKVINNPIHIYYTDRPESVTNDINKMFFEKYLILEKEKVKRLKSYGVLSDFINLRYDKYFKLWYIDKFERLDQENKQYTMEILLNIYDLYKEDWRIKDSKVRDFINIIKVFNFK